MKTRTSAWISLVIFALVISAMLLLFLLMPDRAFSEVENRMLAHAPELSWASVSGGDYMEDFETWLTDQFPFRDRWTDLKARCEHLLLKKEYNGVYLCADGTLITRFDEPDESLVQQNIDAVNTLCADSGAQVYLALIPNAACVWADKLPADAPNADQRALIESIYARCDARPVDVYAPLHEHADEYIFYRTDHHWTTEGAYYGYTAFADAAGFAPVPLSEYTAHTESERFYGTVYSSSGVHWTAPDVITSYVPDAGVTVTNYSDGKPHEGRVYDRSFLDKKDKYAMFYGGNTPLLVIETGHADKPRLLILRDSYMDSESPFLFAHYSEIHMIDLRYYRLSLSDYIREHGFDQILVSYAVANFATDRKVMLAAS